MRKRDLFRARFRLYLKHILLRARMHLDVPIGIVAPKVAGSSPVGHPSTFRIDKPNRQKAKESRYKRQGLLTPLWHHSGEAREV